MGVTEKQLFDANFIPDAMLEEKKELYQENRQAHYDVLHQERYGDQDMDVDESGSPLGNVDMGIIDGDDQRPEAQTPIRSTGSRRSTRLQKQNTPGSSNQGSSRGSRGPTPRHSPNRPGMIGGPNTRRSVTRAASAGVVLDLVDSEEGDGSDMDVDDESF